MPCDYTTLIVQDPDFTGQPFFQPYVSSTFSNNTDINVQENFDNTIFQPLSNSFSSNIPIVAQHPSFLVEVHSGFLSCQTSSLPVNTTVTTHPLVQATKEDLLQQYIHGDICAKPSDAGGALLQCPICNAWILEQPQQLSK